MIDDLSQARERRQHRAFDRMQKVLRQRQEDQSVRSPARSFADVEALLETLRREHEYGRFAYRGQMVRPDRFAGEQAIERLLPGDFRFFWREPDHKQEADEITRMRENGRDRRDRFFKFLQARSTAGDPRLAWLATGFRLFEAKFLNLDYLLSIAMYATSMLETDSICRRPTFAWSAADAPAPEKSFCPRRSNSRSFGSIAAPPPPLARTELAGASG